MSEHQERLRGYGKLGFTWMNDVADALDSRDAEIARLRGRFNAAVEMGAAADARIAVLETALREIVQASDGRGPADGDYELGCEDTWNRAADVARTALGEPS